MHAEEKMFRGLSRASARHGDRPPFVAAHRHVSTKPDAEGFIQRVAAFSWAQLGGPCSRGRTTLRTLRNAFRIRCPTLVLDSEDGYLWMADNFAGSAGGRVSPFLSSVSGVPAL
jgi:hypothetical protein